MGPGIVVAGAWMPAKISFSTYSTCVVSGQLVSSLLYDATGTLRKSSAKVEVVQVVGVVIVLLSSFAFRMASKQAWRLRLRGAEHASRAVMRLLRLRRGTSAEVLVVGDDTTSVPTPAEPPSGSCSGVVVVTSGADVCPMPGEAVERRDDDRDVHDADSVQLLQRREQHYRVVPVDDAPDAFASAVYVRA